MVNMMISVLNLFSIGIGPSSSHTVGPMKAAKSFLVRDVGPDLTQITRLVVTLYGSLAYTGKGHGTDKAITMGLTGEDPDTIDPASVDISLQAIHQTHTLRLLNTHAISIMPTDLVFNKKELLPFHTNGLRFQAYNAAGTCFREAIYYSVGGGFIVHDQDTQQPPKERDVPYPFDSAAALLAHAARESKTIADIIFANEIAMRPEDEVKRYLLNVANTMHDCIYRGCHAPLQTTLPGTLKVRRRAPALYARLFALGHPEPQHPEALNWLNTFAMAVNEENACGGRVVTAPTNGAAGIIPAVLEYYQTFYPQHPVSEAGILTFLLTAGGIGILYKKNASISGAEMGCQGEVGVACSMAAAGLAAALGGSNAQIENAAEIGMEHNLGLTCDPIGGLVQIPCIERNAMGAIKAIDASRIAMIGDGTHVVSLDTVIATMLQTGRDMRDKYKETSKGGLAVSVVEC